MLICFAALCPGRIVPVRKYPHLFLSEMTNIYYLGLILHFPRRQNYDFISYFNNHAYALFRLSDAYISSY